MGVRGRCGYCQDRNGKLFSKHKAVGNIDNMKKEMCVNICRELDTRGNLLQDDQFLMIRAIYIYAAMYSKINTHLQVPLCMSNRWSLGGLIWSFNPHFAGLHHQHWDICIINPIALTIFINTKPQQDTTQWNQQLIFTVNTWTSINISYYHVFCMVWYDRLVKIRLSWDRLIFKIRIPILIGRHLYIETAPRLSFQREMNK